MSDIDPGRLTIADRASDGWVTIEVSGPLRWPDAAQLTKFLLDATWPEQLSIVLDLTGLTATDSTGVAVLAGAAAQLEHTGREVRVVVPDEPTRRQLPRTAGLRQVYLSVDEAVGTNEGRTA